MLLMHTDRFWINYNLSGERSNSHYEYLNKGIYSQSKTGKGLQKFKWNDEKHVRRDGKVRVYPFGEKKRK